MGNEAQLKKIISKELKKEERFWETVRYKIVNGRKVSVICRKNPNDSSSLPYYTDTSDIYLILNRKENMIKQMAIYDTNTHFRVKDFDWSHNHNNEFKKGELHIHPDVFENKVNNTGRETRPATEKEKRYLKYILKELGYDYSRIRFD